MLHRNRRFAGAILPALALAVALVPGTALAAAPERESDAYTDRFHDDFIADLCGIDTYTTVTERWVLTTWANGSQTLQVTRTFVPEDPRIPLEKGAGIAFFSPDGSVSVVGKPIQLFRTDGHGVWLLDAGRVMFDPDGNLVDVRGPHPSLDVDLAEYYCP